MAFVRPALARSVARLARPQVTSTRTFLDLSFIKGSTSLEGVYVSGKPVKPSVSTQPTQPTPKPTIQV